MLFDQRAIVAAAACFYTVFTGLLLAIYRTQKTYRGFERWTASAALLAVGMLVVALKPASSNWSNVIFVSAAILGTEANRAFRELKPRLWSLYAIGVTAILAAAYAEYLENVNWRNIAMASSHCVNACVSAAALLPRPPRGRELGLRVTGTMYGMFAFVSAVRVAYFWLAPPIHKDPHVADIFLPTVPNGVFSLLGILTLACCCMGWLIMFYERLSVALRKREAMAREAAARERAASQAKVEFLATMGHEMRNPLAAVLALTDLMLETQLTAEQREYEVGVRTSIEALLRVTEDVLDLSKLESGEVTIESRPFDVISAVGAVVTVFRPPAAKKGLDITLEYADNAPRLLVGDPGRIRQVVTNFVANAVKFTKKGHIRIMVDRQFVSEAAVKVHVSVADTGIGIPPEMTGTVFDRSGRAYGLTAPSYGGAGVGLRISKRLIEIMGGQVGVESATGQGSTFWFDLTLRIAPPCVGSYGQIV